MPEAQTEAFKNLANSAENSDMNDILKKVINEVQELSDDQRNNDQIDISGLLGAHFENLLVEKITKEQANTILKELKSLIRHNEYDEQTLKQIDDLRSLLESLSSGEQRKASFDKFSTYIPSAINRLKEELSRADRRNIEEFIKSPENKNTVLNVYLSMLSVPNLDNVQDATRNDKRIFNEIKQQIETEYDNETRGEWELDAKIFTDIFFKKWIENNPDWDGSTKPTDDTKVKEMYQGPHMFTKEQFIAKFEEKNNNRIADNTQKINNYINQISETLDLSAVTKKAGDNGETLWINGEELTVGNYREKLNISITTPEGVTLTSTEVAAAINTCKEEIFNKIKEKARVEEAPNTETPAIEELTEESIKAKMRGRPPITKQDIIDAITDAKNQLGSIEDQTKKQEITRRINEDIIPALKEPGEFVGNRCQPNIKALQEKMKADGENLIIDGKFGPNTLGAMINYIQAGASEQVDPADANDPDATQNDPEEAQNGVENPIENSLKELESELENKDFMGKQRIKNNIIDKDGPDREDGVRTLQLHLLPVYKGKIDGKFGPNTLKALQKYTENPLYKNKDDNAGDLGDLLTPEDINCLYQKCVSISKGNNKFTAYFHDGNEITYTRNATKHQMEFSIGSNTYEFAGDHFYKDGAPSNDIPDLLKENKSFLKSIYEKHKLVPTGREKTNYTRDADALLQGTTVYKINNISHLINADEFPVHSCVEYNNIRFHKNNRCYNFKAGEEKMGDRSKNGNSVTITYEDGKQETLS